MAKLKVLGGDFADRAGSNYFMGEFTLWGWKQGQTKLSKFRLRVGRDVVDVRLLNSSAMPVGASGVGGAARGAMVGAAVGGTVGAVAGAILGGASSAASAKVYNRLQGRGLQKFTVTFKDGRTLEAEMDTRIVMGLQQRLLRANRRRRET